MSGAYNLKVTINATQTACSSSGGVVTSTAAMNATAVWPSITVQSTLDWVRYCRGLRWMQPPCGASQPCPA